MACGELQELAAHWRSGHSGALALDLIVQGLLPTDLTDKDENRYNANHATHLNLKRGEKVWNLVNKISAMVTLW
ncbi:hypothetical protein Nepgr_027345 [Nepenthes gracilis]|uniref:Uncharacterized protein n=1 Tax=Nepenthes gracilis TaxID=150966 RepID=A0AAD3TBK7_NEPGR|nr:hypothetical protein Nepgr_027345 [Nepenthes gracilis]